MAFGWSSIVRRCAAGVGSRLVALRPALAAAAVVMGASLSASQAAVSCKPGEVLIGGVCVPLTFEWQGKIGSTFQTWAAPNWALPSWLQPPSGGEGPPHSGQKAKPANRIVGNGYAFLDSQGAERRGYGLYTYVLLTPSNGDRVKAMLEAVLHTTGRVETLGGDIARINVIYLPFAQGPDPGGNPPIDEVAARYNFDLSRALIQTICEMSAPEVSQICRTGLSSGPYLFSYAAPIGKAGELTPPVLFVDLTTMREGTFTTLVDAYKEQIKSEDITDGQKINSLYIRALNIVETAKDWTSPVAKAAEPIVRLISSGSGGDDKDH